MDSKDILLNFKEDGIDILYLHGWLLWVAWGVLGFI